MKMKLFVPEHPCDRVSFVPEGVRTPSIPASNLLSLQCDSLRQAPVLSEGASPKGTREYYEEVAQTIVGYAYQDPDECVRFLTTVYLPGIERMSERRREKQFAQF